MCPIFCAADAIVTITGELISSFRRSAREAGHCIGMDICDRTHPTSYSMELQTARNWEVETEKKAEMKKLFSWDGCQQNLDMGFGSESDMLSCLAS